MSGHSLWLPDHEEHTGTVYAATDVLDDVEAEGAVKAEGIGVRGLEEAGYTFGVGSASHLGHHFPAQTLPPGFVKVSQGKHIVVRPSRHDELMHPEDLIGKCNELLDMARAKSQEFRNRGEHSSLEEVEQVEGATRRKANACPINFTIGGKGHNRAIVLEGTLNASIEKSWKPPLQFSLNVREHLSKQGIFGE